MLSGVIKPMSSSIFISMLQRVLIFQKTLFESIKNKHGIEIDEIMEYRQCRYICDKDGCWRIYGFDIHSKMPSVERLPVHLY